MSNLGYTEDETCNRNGCVGVIKLNYVGSCSCHINPPCSHCTDATAYCEVCDWDESSDPLVVKDPVAYHFLPMGGVFTETKKRVLDNTKIDYIIQTHTNFSQKCIGVYPEGTTREDVRKKVDGTFGGRFESFGNGHFVYIAYTD